MLAAQQQQLQQLQGAPAATANNARSHKRKSADPDIFQEEGGESAEEEAPLDKDDGDWDPEQDSDYEDAPKKKKKGSSSSKGRKKQKRRDSFDDDDSCSDSDADVGVRDKQQEKVAKAAAVALRSVKTAINQQMVYRPGLKHGNSRVSLELPCLSEAIVQAMMGPQLLAKASNGKKQLQLKASNQDLAVMYNTGWGGRPLARPSATVLSWSSTRA